MSNTPLRVYDHEIEQLIEHGRTDEAVAHCRHVLQSFPRHLETHRLLGKAYLESRRYAEAVDILERVLLSVPNDFVSHVGLSIAADERGDLDAAIWHMQRAFESQPANQAIQGELQRLFGRRDGLEPPKIRMTRGALAQMYVQGELFPQAISEIRAVLSQDQQRPDLQVLLAHAYFRAGQVADATELCRRLLADRPYCLEANRIMAELAPPGGGESDAAPYRRRVVELDPYAAHSPDTLARADQVSDSAVQVQRLDYSSQPPDSAMPWVSALGATAASDPTTLGVGEQPGSSADGNPAPTSGPGPHAAVSVGAPAQAWPSSPSWMEAGSAAGGPDAATSRPFETTDELTPAQLPDWLKEKMPVDEPSWQGDRIAGSTPPPLRADSPAAPPRSDEASLAASRPSTGVEIPGESVPSWLKDLGQGKSEDSAGAAGQSKSATLPIDWQVGEVGEPFDAAAFEEALRAPPDAAEGPLGWFTALTDGDAAAPDDSSPAAPDWARAPQGPEGPSRRSEAEALSQLLPASDGLPPSDPTGWLRSLQPQAADFKDGSSLPESEGQPSIADQDGPAWLQSTELGFKASAATPAQDTVAGRTPETMSAARQPEELEEELVQEPDSSPLDADRLPAWLGGIDAAGAQAGNGLTELGSVESESPDGEAPLSRAPASPGDSGQALPEAIETGIPGWLRGFDEPGSPQRRPGSIEAPPEWLDAEAHEAPPQPTAPSDWRPIGDSLSRPTSPAAGVPDQAGTTVPSADVGDAARDQAALAQARDGLQRGEIPSALGTYERLIRRGVHLDETLRDLRDATHRYPVDVNVWQTLGDAYMRLNRLQEALDAYNKAEEMLR